MIYTAAASEVPTEADWIIVGGGAGGCTAATALVDAGEDVLVIERGPSDMDVPDTQSGNTWPNVIPDNVEPIRWKSGAWGGVAKVLGGGASVNDGYYFEETPEWIKEHFQLSDEEVDLYFAGSKFLTDKLTTPLARTDYGMALAEATMARGHGIVDFDHPQVRYKEGAWVIRSLFNSTSPDYTRNTPAHLLHARANLPNLKVLTGTLVTKVNFDGNRASGVDVKSASKDKVCPEGTEQLGAYCYEKCKTGYKRVGVQCYQECPAKWRDDGVYCRSAEYGRGAGYPWKAGDKPLPNMSGMFARCEAAHGKGNCEKWGLVVYPKCAKGYAPAGCCVCRPDDLAGNTEFCLEQWLLPGVDLSCKKHIVTPNPESMVDPPPTTITARKGVIMAAGAIYTPQILQISGVGPQDLITKLGVEQVADLPVGKNFVDRPTWSVQIIAPEAQKKFLGYTVSTNETLGVTIESVGGAGVGNFMAGVSLALSPADQRSASLRPFIRFFMEQTPIGNTLDSMYNIIALQQDPQSRGVVEARSLNSDDHPFVHANFYDESTPDLERQVANMQELVNIINEPSLDPYRLRDLPLSHPLAATEMMFNSSTTCSSLGFASIPCPPTGAATWGPWLKENVLSTWHYFGTSAVGDVLEPGTFKVKNTEGLYVADASAIPRATRVNPVGTIMALGYYVGAKIAKDSQTGFGSGFPTFIQLPENCANNLGDQCGGRSFTGSTCCPESTECYEQSQRYSQCLKSCPSAWSCNKGELPVQISNSYTKMDNVSCRSHKIKFDKNGFEKTYKTRNFAKAKDYCDALGDACVGVYDSGCDGKGKYILCGPSTTPLKSKPGNCIHMKQN